MPVVTCTQPPGVLWRTALSKRLWATWSRRAGSPHPRRIEGGIDPQPALHRVTGQLRDSGPDGVGQVDGLGVPDGPLAAGQHEQALDEALAAGHGVAHGAGHRAHLVGPGVGVGQSDVDLGAHDRERCPQLVRGVGHEAALTVEGGVEATEHGVERVGQFLEVIGRAGEADALGEVLLGQALGRGRDVVQGRSTRPATTQPSPTDATAMSPRAVADCTSNWCRAPSRTRPGRSRSSSTGTCRPSISTPASPANGTSKGPGPRAGSTNSSPGAGDVNITSSTGRLRLTMA